MNKFWKPVFKGILAIFLLDSIGSITSEMWDYEYTSLVYISYLIYGLTGFSVYKSSLKLTYALVGGAILGLFDSTIGWWISDVLDAKVVRLAMDSATRIIVVVYVVIITAIVSLIGGVIGKFLRKSQHS